ncbi:MAG TPA: efflux RND transporter periplasmic adaptor subunit [Vicinamibacterales bacterium]|nr:efflux RND transporter periplasmic adaptor subunit [Vicinamibacterales bacterium]
MFKSVGSLVCLLAVLAAAACSGTAADPAGGAGAGGRGAGRGGRGGGRGGGGAAQPVVVTRVTQRDVPVDLAAVGNVEAYASVSVRSQVTGQLQEAFFREGDIVKKGDKLFAIDQRPLEAALQQAEANLTRDRALLNQAEAQLVRDTANAEYQQASSDRQAALIQKGIVSKEQAEQARAAAAAMQATMKADTAAVESAKAQLEVQQAVVDNAKVQLSYAVIRATIDGRTGNNTIKVGNLVQANGTELVTIAQLQPVYVTFAVPASNLPAIKHISPGQTLAVVATPQDGNPEPVDGKLTFVDNLVDSTTDTIKLKATFPNKDFRLWPGQFTRVSLRLSVLPHATVIPSQAVQVGQDGQFVFVVKEDSTVEQRPVTLGQRMGEIVVIDKGLSPGETVVTEGQLRLEQGTKVQIGDANGSSEGGRGGRGGRGRGGRSGGL